MRTLGSLFTNSWWWDSSSSCRGSWPSTLLTVHGCWGYGMSCIWTTTCDLLESTASRSDVRKIKEQKFNNNFAFEWNMCLNSITYLDLEFTFKTAVKGENRKGSLHSKLLSTTLVTSCSYSASDRILVKSFGKLEWRCLSVTSHCALMIEMLPNLLLF